MTGGFFDRYPRFFETSNTSATPERLNARYQAIIEANRAAMRGSRILDIGSHDGRWSFAALEAGAVHVTGVEPRGELIQHAIDNMRAYGVEGSSYEFVRDDIFSYLAKGHAEFDVILCLGYFYHTLNHLELLRLMTHTTATSMVLDTEVFPVSEDECGREYGGRSIQQKDFLIQILKDPVGEEMMAFEDDFTRHGCTLVGRPSVGAVRLMLGHFGWKVREHEWAGLLVRDCLGLQDYRDGWRKTFVCER